MGKQMSSVKNNNGSNIEVYLKIIEYKRSIGITQWTVLSIFVTVSQGVLVLTVNQGTGTLTSSLLLVFGAAIYWFGYLLYNRYRGLNKQVAEYLVELEQENGFKFQQSLNKFHKKGRSTRQILLVGGIVYLVFVIVLSIV